ncbi:ionotropic receptor 25a [Prorops nasuta]|uniref:ionotropic receptor 25a n=1 Tax=Prorops nasuta TaxID=863751 RepID=UPI0034CE03F7
MTYHFIVFYIFLLTISYFTNPINGQTTRTTSRPVNLFIINDERNIIANKSVENALKKIQEDSPEILGKVYTVTINDNNMNDALDKICSVWDSSVKSSLKGMSDLVLDLTVTGPIAELTNSFTAALGLPTLSAQYGQAGDLRYWRNLNSDKSGYLIQVMPPADVAPEVARQLAVRLKIFNAAILFDDNFIMEHKYKSLFLNIPTRHMISRVGQTVEDVKSQLSRFRDLDIVNFFVFGDKLTLSRSLEAAKYLNFTGRKYGWFALTLHKFTPGCACENMTFLFMDPIPPSGKDESHVSTSFKSLLQEPLITSAFYYDLTFLGVEAMRTALEDGDWPMEPPHITCDEYNTNNTPTRNFDFLAKLKFVSESFKPTYAGFHWGSKNGEHQAKFEMSLNLISIALGNMIGDEVVGNWPAGIDEPLKITKEEIVNHTAVTSYRVVTVVHPPFVMYDPVKNEWSGYCIDLLEETRQHMKFEYDIREVDDKEYGKMNEDGTWNGMMRELIEKRADVALGSLWVMAERENVVDFTVPYYDLVGLTILMLKPKAPTSLFKFLTVLENEVWFSILAAYFFTSFLMWVFDRWSPYSYQNNREKYKDDEEKREFTLRECLWFCMTSLTPQGGGEAPKNLSGRLVAATWWLFGFIIIASYTANLAAFLTVSRLDTPIESLDDLSKQYKIQYGPVLGSAAYTYFQRMADIETRFYEIWKDMSLNDSLSEIERAKLAVWDYPVSDKYTKMFQAMKEAGFPKTTEEALRRVRRLDSNNEFAFIGDASTIKYLVATNCEFVQVGDEFSRKPYAIAVQQGSPLKDQFNDAILVLLNRRILEKMKDKWWKLNPEMKVCEKEDDQSDGISIQNIGGVFIVIFVGIALACLTLAFEYWWFRYRPKAREIRGGRRSQQNKIPKEINPVRISLQPAPTHGFLSQYRTRF